MRDVDKHGIARVCEMAIEALDPSHSCPIHLSLDIDGVDPHFAPGTGTCARGGLSYREVHYVCEEMSLTGRLVRRRGRAIPPSLPRARPRAREHRRQARACPHRTRACPHRTRRCRWIWSR